MRVLTQASEIAENVWVSFSLSLSFSIKRDDADSGLARKYTGSPRRAFAGVSFENDHLRFVLLPLDA